MTDLQRIIDLLEEDRASREERQRHLDARIDELQSAINRLNQNSANQDQYFIGLTPREHILQHAKIQDAEEIAKGVRMSFYGAIISVIIALAVALAQYVSSSAQQDLAEQVAVIAKQSTKDK